MRDLDVRLAVRSRLGAEHAGDPDTRIVEEMGIWNGSVRVDLAVINGKLAGYELKSAKDNLQRLPTQASLFSQVFDRVFLVAAEKHVEKAAERIPDWWGILSAHQTENGVSLQEVRVGNENPATDPLQVARLLWRDEALSILDAYGYSKGVKTASRETIVQRLVSSLSPSELSSSVRYCLKGRSGWLGQAVSDQ